MSSHLKHSKNDFLRMALLLFLIAAMVGAVLAVVHFYTEPIVKRSAEERLQEALQELMPDAGSFEIPIEYPKEIVLGTVHVPVKTVYRAENAGYCVHVQPQGYSDLLELLVAIDQGGAVKDVEILSISDTPGIGLKVQSNKKFRSAVNGLTDSAKIVKETPDSKEEIQVISGATVTSSAYINGVNAAIEAVQILRAQEVQQ